MAQAELQVIVKAKQLAKHTLQLTSNCNRYPKKFRFSLVDKMQNKCLNIYEALMEANRTDGNCYKLCQSMDMFVEELMKGVDINDSAL